MVPLALLHLFFSTMQNREGHGTGGVTAQEARKHGGTSLECWASTVNPEEG